MQYLIKIVITALLVASISEAGKRFTTLGAILASIPLTSLFAFLWLYAETKDTQKVSNLSWEILMMVIPSLLFFIALPLFLKVMKFYPALLLSAIVTAVAYFAWIALLRKLGFNI